MAEKQMKKNGPPAGGPGNKMRFEKPANPAKTLLRLLSYVVKNKAVLVLVAVLVVISSGAGVAGTYLLTPIINEIGAVVQNGTFDVTNIIKYLVIIGIIYVCGAAAGYAYQRLMLNISQGTLNLLRKDLFDHLQSLPIKFFDSHTHGELMSRFTNDTDTIREEISQGLVQTISSLVTVIGIFSMMIYISPALTGLIIIMLFVILTYRPRKINQLATDAG